MAQMLIPADAIAQQALRYLHLLQQQPLHRFVLDRLPSPGKVRLHDPGPKPSPNDSISDVHLAQLSAEDSGRYRFGPQKISCSLVCIWRAVAGGWSRFGYVGESESLRIDGWRDGEFVVSTS